MAELVPPDFDVPLGLETEDFVLEPLGPEHNEADYDAWTSSIDHITKTPGFPWGSWPRAMTPEDNRRDLERHADDFRNRQGFTYTVLEPGDRDVIGCVYIYPSRHSDDDAIVQSWVRASHAHLDVPLWRAVGDWLASDWPFTTVKYAPRGCRGSADDAGSVDREGFELRWIREGEGVPLLVLGALSFYPRYFPRALRDHFEIVFCDLRQWVPTPPGFDVATITRDTYSADVDAIVEAAGLDRPIVAGHSQHGTIALEYAQRHPARVRGVAAIAAPPPAGSRRVEPNDAFFARDASPERQAVHARNLATRRSPDTLETSRDFIDAYLRNDAKRWYDADFDGSPLWEGVEPNVEVIGRVFAPHAFGGFTLDPLRLPTFLALGRYDYAIPYSTWDEPKQRFANLSYHLYDRSGHNPPFEQPEAFTADLAAWADELETAG